MSPLRCLRRIFVKRESEREKYRETQAPLFSMACSGAASSGLSPFSKEEGEKREQLKICVSCRNAQSAARQVADLVSNPAQCRQPQELAGPSAIVIVIKGSLRDIWQSRLRTNVDFAFQPQILQKKRERPGLNDSKFPPISQSRGWIQKAVPCFSPLPKSFACHYQFDHFSPVMCCVYACTSYTHID